MSYRQLKQVVQYFDEGTKQYGNAIKIFPVPNYYFFQKQIIERSNDPLTLEENWLFTRKVALPEIVEDKVDRLVDRLENLTITIIKKTEEDAPAQFCPNDTGMVCERVYAVISYAMVLLTVMKIFRKVRFVAGMENMGNLRRHGTQRQLVTYMIEKTLKVRMAILKMCERTDKKVLPM